MGKEKSSEKPVSNPWKKASPGVEYMLKQRPGRLRPDCYYRIHFQVNKKRHCFGLGWESGEGNNGFGIDTGDGIRRVTLDYAISKRRQYMDNITNGERPTSPKDEIKLNQEKAEEAEEERKRQARDRMTFSEFWETYYYKAWSKKSWKQEKGFYDNYIRPALGDKPLKEITRLDLEALVNSVNGSNRNKQYVMAVVRQVFNRAIDLDFYPFANPVKKGVAPTSNRERKRTLSYDEEEKLLKALWEKSELSHDLALTSLYTGMRFSEIARMRWADIDWDRQKITIWDAKDPSDAEKVRYAMFPDFIKEMFQRRYEKSKSELVFPGKFGEVMENVPRTFGRVVHELGLNQGITDSKNKLVFYSLRHTYASRLMEKNVHDFTIMELMGHSDIRMTKKYSHCKDYQKLEAARLFDKKPGKVVNIQEYKQAN